MTNVQATGLTDRDLITNILNNYFIVDYGYINKVNNDGTVNITHAAKSVLFDGTELPETTTDNVQVLTICGAGFALEWDYKAADKVLILGLKDYVPNVSSVTKAETPKAFIHYDRANIKVIPLCVFSDEAKVKVKVKNGKMAIDTEDLLYLDGDNNGGLVIGPELKKQLGYLTARVDAIINALESSQTAAEDGGAAYKAGITATLNQIANKEDFSNIESKKVMHGE